MFQQDMRPFFSNVNFIKCNKIRNLPKFLELYHEFDYIINFSDKSKQQHLINHYRDRVTCRYLSKPLRSSFITVSIVRVPPTDFKRSPFRSIIILSIIPTEHYEKIIPSDIEIDQSILKLTIFLAS